MPRLYVPEHPTTQNLREKYPQTPMEYEAVLAERERVSYAFSGNSPELFASIGPCAMTAAEMTLLSEAEQLALLNGIVGTIREPDFKPRSDPDAWHGLITTEPETAYRILRNTSRKLANVAMEIGTDPEHLKRNAPFLTMAWKGGRNDDKPELTEMLALYDPTLPIAIKNGLDGDLEKAIAEVEKIEGLRGHLGARAILLFRGGINAKTPEAWEEQYLRAYDLTEGRFLVDWAHGGEQAHDPGGKFDKSIKGQRACMEHTIDLARTGNPPAGILSEASKTPSPTDPVQDFDTAIDGTQRLAKVKQSLFV